MPTVDTPDWTSGAPTVGANWLILAATPTIGGPSTYLSPLLFVGAFTAISVAISNQSGLAAFQQIEWFNDGVGSVLVNSEPVFHNTNLSVSRTAFATKGPYVQLTIGNSGVSSGTWGAQINGISGSGPSADGYGPQILSDSALTAVPGSSTTNINVNPSTSGHATFWAIGTGSGLAGVQRWSGTAWVTVGEGAVAANTPTLLTLNLPGDDLRVTLQNLGGTTNNFQYSLAHGA